jgi:hypothetical protein
MVLSKVRASAHLVSKVVALSVGLIWLAPAFANQIIVIQPVIAGATGVATPDIARDLLFTSAIYGQDLIDIQFLPTESSTSLSSNLVENDTGVFPYVTSPLYAAAPFVTVFYVATIDSNASNRGASTCYGSYCAAWVANSAANDTFAHELAHILTGFLALWDPNPSDPSHSTDPTNLLASGDIRNVPATVAAITASGSVFDRIAPIQEAAMLDSQYAQSEVPEPDSVILLASGLFLLVSFRRAKTAAR